MVFPMQQLFSKDQIKQQLRAIWSAHGLEQWTEPIPHSQSSIKDP